MYYKNEEEIFLIKESSLLVSKTLALVGENIKLGIQTLQLDYIAKEFIMDSGGIPAFLGYRGFPATLCMSINDEVVHGIPSSREIREGDVVSVDCGALLNGYYGDSAYTFAVLGVDEGTQNLIKITKECLYKGVEKAIDNLRLGDVSYAIQKNAEDNGFSVVRELCGHGIGKNLHEKPNVNNYGKQGVGIKLKKNLVIAIEPMINKGMREVYYTGEKNWVVKTKDGMPSAHFEHTIVVKEKKAEILSDFSIIEQKIEKNNILIKI